MHLPNIGFMHLRLVEVAVPAVVVLYALLGYYSTRLLEGLRKFYAPAGMFLLDIFSPRNRAQAISIWVHWFVVTLLFVLAAGMPSVSMAPDIVQKGAVEVEFVIQVNNAMGDESDRPNHPNGDPGRIYQWGTRLDMVKRFIENDMLPQLAGNKTGITTVEGLGYNMWDLTDDNQSPTGGFRVMLDNFTRVGAAPGAGANYASGIETALAEFDLIDGMERQAGDTSKKVHFIVLFADGNYSQDGKTVGDPKLLSKAEQDLKNKGVHLLIVGMGEPDDVSVPHYDPLTHQRDGSFEGQTRYQPQVLQGIANAVPGAQLIYAPPGTRHVKYDFPREAGNLTAVPSQSNLYVWLVAAALGVLLLVTFTGGRMPTRAAIAAGYGPLLRKLSPSRLKRSLSELRRRSSRNSS